MIDQEHYNECQLDGLLADQYRRHLEARANLNFWRSEAASSQQLLEAALGPCTKGSINGETVLTYDFEVDQYGNKHRVFRVVAE